METIILYPCRGLGHLVAIVELAKLILKHQPSFSIVIFVTVIPFDLADPLYINRVSTAFPSISFRTLPAISNMNAFFFEVPRLNVPDVREALLSISQTSKVTAFVLDFFCYTSFEVSTSLNIPTYFFYTSGASPLCFFLYFTTIHETITQNFKDADTFINVPGTLPIHTLDVPLFLFVRDSVQYTHFLNMSTSMAKSSGIIVNTFQMLESRAIKALSDGDCVPKGWNSPRIYPIGPLISYSDDEGRGDDKHECLKWLDAQPERSVVYLCFGTVGRLKLEQLKEMAVGLERSGQRFLWVVRSPPGEYGAPPADESDLESLLPEGFLERNKERGFVVKTWAPQVAVLSHPSVGGFVCHCGWNSVLEAIWNGLPMVAWPLYAEQRMNKRNLVDEFKIALPLEFSEGGFVTAAELEKRVKELLDSEKVKAIRDRVAVLKEGAKAAIEEDGSSQLTFAELLNSWKQFK